MNRSANFVNVVDSAAPTKKSPSIKNCLRGGLQNQSFQIVNKPFNSI